MDGSLGHNWKHTHRGRDRAGILALLAPYSQKTNKMKKKCKVEEVHLFNTRIFWK